MILILSRPRNKYSELRVVANVSEIEVTVDAIGNKILQVHGQSPVASSMSSFKAGLQPGDEIEVQSDNGNTHATYTVEAEDDN